VGDVVAMSSPSKGRGTVNQDSEDREEDGGGVHLVIISLSVESCKLFVIREENGINRKSNQS
jgi:hypothetical protein